MSTAPKRRWSYSLRTLFVVVTILGVCLGWVVHSIQWIRMRREWIDAPPTVYVHMRGYRRAPWSLVPFGVHGYAIISMRFCPWDEPEPILTDEEIKQFRRLKQLFPEAIISTSPLDSLRPEQLRTFQ